MTDQITDFDQLLSNLDQAMQVDRHRLRRQLLELRKQAGTPACDALKRALWLERYQQSCNKVAARRLIGTLVPEPGEVG